MGKIWVMTIGISGSSGSKGVLGKSKVKNLYLKGDVVVLLGEVFPQGSLSYLFGHERPGDHFGLEKPCLTTGHHLTHFHRCIKKALDTLKFMLKNCFILENQEINIFKSNHNV